jgi:hypothetical protein
VYPSSTKLLFLPGQSATSGFSSLPITPDGASKQQINKPRNRKPGDNLLCFGIEHLADTSSLIIPHYPRQIRLWFYLPTNYPPLSNHHNSIFIDRQTSGAESTY